MLLVMFEYLIMVEREWKFYLPMANMWRLSKVVCASLKCTWPS